MKSYAAVIFDWDGTVMDSTPCIVNAIQSACHDIGLPIPADEDASWVIGLSLDAAIQRCVPSMTDAQLPTFIERYRHHFLARDHELLLFEGMSELLAELRERDVRLGVATGKSRFGLSRVLKSQSLEAFFDCTRCADETQSKPHPQMLWEILEHLKLAPEQVLMVGDTSHDIEMAAAAGMDSMAVTYGAHTLDSLEAAQPTVIVESVAQMRQWLLERVPAARLVAGD